MTDASQRHERGYRVLLALYPRAFRRDYGDALAQFFRDDVRARGAARGWARALTDLLKSVPVQHVEATVVERSAVRTLLMLGLPVLGAFAAIGFGRVVVLTVPIALAVSVGLYLSSRRAYNEAVVGVSGSWWKVLAAGFAVLTGIGAADDWGPDLEWFPWYLAVMAFLIGWSLIVTGVALGLLHLWRTVRRRPAASL